MLVPFIYGAPNTQANGGSAGGTMWWQQVGTTKYLWGQSATQTIGGAAPVSTSVQVNLPTFFNTIQSAVVAGVNINPGSIFAYSQANTVNTTTLLLVFTMTVGTAGQWQAHYFVIGT